MATQRTSWAAQSARLVESVGRVTLIGVFTGVETIALVVWLGFVQNSPAASQMAAIGLGILAIGLFVEHYLTDLAVNGWGSTFPVGPAVLFSATEAGLWALWLGIVENVPARLVVDSLASLGVTLPAGLAETADFLLAAVILTILLVPQHTVEDNVLRGRGTFSSLFRVGTLSFSVVESFGATAWLLFVVRPDVVEPLLADLGVGAVATATLGVGLLAGSLLVEHLIGVSFARR
jgi:hypothetical protein